MDEDSEFSGRIGRKASRKARHRRQHRSAWFGLGVFGLVGWSVAIPALLGIALGLWLDTLDTGPYSWTLMLLSIGVALGCLNAWYWVRQERDKIEEEKKE